MTGLIGLLYVLSAGEVVSNPTRPSSDTWTMTFTEEVVIDGQDSDQTFYWTAVQTGVAVTEDGTILVVDPAESRIVAYDSKGHFQGIVAAKGQGPGEFQDLLDFEVLNNGKGFGIELVGGGFPIFKHFGSELKADDQATARGPRVLVLATVISPGGKHLGANFIMMDPPNKRMMLHTAIVDHNFQMTKLLSRHERSMPTQDDYVRGDFWRDFIATNLEQLFAGIGVYNFAPDGTLYEAANDTYEIRRWDGGEQPVLTIRRDYEPLNLTEADRQALVDGIHDQIPPHPVIQKTVTEKVLADAVAQAALPGKKIPLYGLIITEDHHVLAVHDVDLATRTNTADIFSPEGRYLGQTTLKDNGFVTFYRGAFIPRMVFRHGKAYTVQTDSEGNQRIVRYAYKLKRTDKN